MAPERSIVITLTLDPGTAETTAPPRQRHAVKLRPVLATGKDVSGRIEIEPTGTAVMNRAEDSF